MDLNLQQHLISYSQQGGCCKWRSEFSYSTKLNLKVKCFYYHWPHSGVSPGLIFSVSKAAALPLHSQILPSNLRAEAANPTEFIMYSNELYPGCKYPNPWGSTSKARLKAVLPLVLKPFILVSGSVQILQILGKCEKKYIIQLFLTGKKIKMKSSFLPRLRGTAVARLGSALELR